MKLFKKKERKFNLEEQLVDYVKKARIFGLSDDEIKLNIMQKNYPENLVLKVFDLVMNQEKPALIEPKDFVPEEKKLSDKEFKIKFKKELKKVKRKERRRLKILWEQWEKGNIVKVESKTQKNK